MSDETDPLVVYLVVRHSDDCSRKMVEIMGATVTFSAACELRDYIYERMGWRCEIEKLLPETPWQSEVDHEAIDSFVQARGQEA